MTIKLLITEPGAGKSHWLRSHSASVYVDCTNRSHRTILCIIADALGQTYTSRASIDDLISIILAAPPATLALDNIDRTSSKLCYTILTLSQRHTILTTATLRRRIAPLIDRQAAILVPPPTYTTANIATIITTRYPDLPPNTARRIAALASTPAAALNIAASVRAGQPLPAPPTRSMYPIVLIASLAAIAYLRYYSDLHLSPMALAAITAAAFYIRRLLWRRTG